MRTRLIALIVIVAAGVALPVHRAQESAANALVLWYRAPAANWNEALPVGNGRLGAMVFGGVTDERLQLNEDTVWAGEKRDRINPGAAKAIPEIRRLLFDGKPVEAEALADKAVVSIPRRMPPYQPVGDLAIRFRGAGDVSDYRRELDLGDADRARALPPGGHHVHPRGVFLGGGSGDRRARQRRSPRTRQLLGDPARARAMRNVRTEGHDVVMEGRAIPTGERQKDERKTGVAFAAVARVARDGRHHPHRRLIRHRRQRGRRHDLRRGRDKRSRARTGRRRAQGADGGRLQAVRSARSRITSRTIGGCSVASSFTSSSPAPALPTDERLARVKAGTPDLALEALYFQFGRYLLIASSRPGHDAGEPAGHVERLS